MKGWLMCSMDNLVKNNVVCRPKGVELLRYDLKVIEENIKNLQKKKEKEGIELNCT
jgi:hypothetical protein